MIVVLALGNRRQSRAGEPKGPSEGTEKMKKGGSFWCHKSYCYRSGATQEHTRQVTSCLAHHLAKI